MTDGIALIVYQQQIHLPLTLERYQMNVDAIRKRKSVRTFSG